MMRRSGQYAIWALLLYTVSAVAVVVPEAPPVRVIDSTGMVAVRPLAEIIGAQLAVQGKVVTVSRDGKSFTYTLDSTMAQQNGKTLALPVAPFSAAGSSYVPVRLLVTSLDGTLEVRDSALRVTFPGLAPFDLPWDARKTPLTKDTPPGYDQFLVTADGSGLQRISYFAQQEDELASDSARQARFTRDGAAILYRDHGMLYRRALDAPNGVKLTDLDEKTSAPTSIVNADGSLLFVDSVKTTAEWPLPHIFRREADGTVRQLAVGTQLLASPDGQTIIYTELDPENHAPVAVHRMKPDGSDNRVLCDKLTALAFNPDGALLYCLQAYAITNPLGSSTHHRLLAVRAGDGTVVGTAMDAQQQPLSVVNDLTVSLDGSQVAVTDERDQRVWLMNADLSGATPLATANVYGVRFSADGRRLCYLKSDRGDLRLYAQELPNGAPVCLTPNLDILTCVISPDHAQFLLFGLQQPPGR